MTSLALPPFIMTSEENSFARETIASRKPLVIDQILADNEYPASIQEALLNFKDELVSGQIRLLEEKTVDKPIWDHDIRPWLGKTWLEIPWYLAEAYFFRRVLEATGYFQPGPWRHMDPYTQLKQKEFTNALPQFVTVYSLAKCDNSPEGFYQAVINALWGNQADLSNLDKDFSASSGSPKRLLKDDGNEALTFLQERPSRLAYCLDNIGKELYFDLALMDYLLNNNFACCITVFLKNQPFFVSDVMPADFEQALDRLSGSSENSIQQLAHRIRNAVQEGKINLEAPPFLTTGRMYRQLPTDLKTQLAQFDLIILKGDVNYRRLVGDRHWDPTTLVGRAAGYFPTAFLSLRTLKSELAVGLTQEQVAWLETNAEPDWMINGNWGLITFLKK